MAAWVPEAESTVLGAKNDAAARVRRATARLEAERAARALERHIPRDHRRPPPLDLPSPLRAPRSLLSSRPALSVSFQPDDDDDAALLRSPPRPFLRSLAAPSSGPCLSV